ncbi:helix-turn-helix domain-containing protein [Schinkia azotoformans]|uniref:helix-turn-helix domain-containing protein n=1 Tax=Schinkia azotoformans TaxID=1454 RepID=UPI002DBA242C|nr:helix-turn-helix transcriptional regulator [Schinkia azotoformans]MEC1772810.1 helix-turn-helix transcriptional regulator [Schinkia azotoformans]MED4367471.1 helix-turn-helix transcriptional regulator [Schinkia azotoformans]
MSNYTMQIFNAIMNNEDYENIRKEVLIEFGFGAADPVQIVNWFGINYPDDYDWIVSEMEENGLHKGIKEVVPSKIQLMSSKDRDNLLNVENEFRSDTRARYVQVNHENWKEIGQSLKQQREELGLGITKLAEMLGTSASRIRNFESGKPVQMASHLEQCYKLAIENYKNSISQQVQNDRKILQIYEDDFDQLKEKFYEFRYESERSNNILDGFVVKYKLEKLFEQYLLDIKQEQQNSDDEYKIAEEMYGDIDEFMRDHSYLFEDFSKKISQ